MKYVIDEDVCSKYAMSLPEVLAVLLVKSCDGRLYETLSQVHDNLILYTDKNSPNLITVVRNAFDDKVCKILLESDKAVPKEDRCETLAIKLRALFPKGMKTGNSAWRGNLREITLKLQKFFKLYGNKWTDEEIVSATERYVKSFNGDYTYMRILKYFILKNTRKVNEDGVGYTEETSDLATCLENPEEIDNIDWTTAMR